MPKSDQTIDIEGFRFHRRPLGLHDPDGNLVSLRPQSLRVLSVLSEQAGELVSKDSLMERVWADTHVTDDSLVQCISEIRKALGPEAGARLRTVPKQGYRLDVSRARPRRLSMLTTVPIAVLAILAALALSALLLTPSQQAASEVQSIAVLPFENLSGSAGQAYYSNGLAEELVVNLSRIADLRVVSRAASFSVAQSASDPRQVARELRVSYLVDGSVRREGQTLRITAALIDGANGENIWADSYAGAEADVFDFQETVLSELVRVLSVRLSEQERERLGVRGTRDVDAFDNYLRGKELAGFLTASDNEQAEEAFAEAIRRDPDYAAAHAQLSIVLSMRVEYGWTSDVTNTLARAVRHAERAVALAPDLPFAHFALGRLLSRGFIADLAGASAEFERAIELDPNYTDAYAFYAIVQVADGRAEDGLNTISEAFARNPVPPYWYYMPLGLANFYLGDYDAAEAALTELLQRNPNLQNALRILIATYGHMGRLDDAEWLVMEYEALGVPATITDIMQAINIEHPPYREAVIDGLRLAGLPE
ncbi:winged helix-turn-helix domain-containing protein [Aestuariicoccus sp. MJ-SS9]|uniref:winged helix-turn-helix domain-containing protein n=1 Tax=Aestuariicoccus sp. MJ-SS9 TaxID=3079855 RepID=UPI0029067480|nr:winged helix-turn-helix domain-containing protein [Aestuariicoccus sp. MJ-SS9]MDU8913978.1 winged helix-turn-helix domain-containing protein [Aestuariicoccus sp. MJ-SS9]